MRKRDSALRGTAKSIGIGINQLDSQKWLSKIYTCEAQAKKLV